MIFGLVSGLSGACSIAVAIVANATVREKIAFILKVRFNEAIQNSYVIKGEALGEQLTEQQKLQRMKLWASLNTAVLRTLHLHE
jgi:hypothetical protein